MLNFFNIQMTEDIYITTLLSSQGFKQGTNTKKENITILKWINILSTPILHTQKNSC